MPLSAAVGFLVSDYQKGQGSVSVYNIPSLSPTLFKKTKTIVPLRALKTNWLLKIGGKNTVVCVCVCMYMHVVGDRTKKPIPARRTFTIAILN